MGPFQTLDLKSFEEALQTLSEEKIFVVEPVDPVKNWGKGRKILRIGRNCLNLQFFFLTAMPAAHEKLENQQTKTLKNN